MHEGIGLCRNAGLRRPERYQVEDFTVYQGPSEEGYGVVRTTPFDLGEHDIRTPGARQRDGRYAAKSVLVLSGADQPEQ